MIKPAGLWLTHNVRSTKYIPIFLCIPSRFMDFVEALLSLLESFSIAILARFAVPFSALP
jgi:hypothetical protein